MSYAIHRRRFIVGAGSTAFLATLNPLRAFGFDLGSVFGTVLGAAGVGLFPGAAAALGGFELIRLVGNAADLAGNANSLVDQTKQLEKHFDSVLTEVSATIRTINSFVQDCDTAVHEIEALVKQLPGAIAAAFDATLAKQAFGTLRGDTANLASYLQSKGTIIANRQKIQSLSDKIVNDISTVDAIQQNDFQAVMQMVPALGTWVQGDTAYNLLVDKNQRQTNPWDHNVVSTISLPRITGLVNTIKQQSKEAGDVNSYVPLDSGVVFTFDGSKFTKTNKAFWPLYSAGQIDNGFYYTIYPTGVVVNLPALPPPPVLQGADTYTSVIGDSVLTHRMDMFGAASAGELSFLWTPPAGIRYWTKVLPPVQLPLGVFQPFPEPPEIAASEAVFAAYPLVMAAALKNVSAVHQLGQGWQIFDDAVQSQLVKGNRDIWKNLPKLKT
jgi:hypothetical protein